jgi:peptidyl-prolyl isomerase E (cyclophilin E)
MQSTLVATRTAAPKTTLYVGGLDDSVNAALLHAAFIPFGEVADVSLPTDAATGAHRGFGFVEFEDAVDADAAIDNMDGAELAGRTLRVNRAQHKGHGGGGGGGLGAVWDAADDWLERATEEKGGGGGGGGAAPPPVACDPMEAAEAAAAGP